VTNWFVNNGDGLTTGYWAVAPWKRATSYPNGSIVRQRGGQITIGVALDITNGKIWLKDLTNNGQWNDSATDDPGTTTGGVTTTVTGPYFPAVSTNNLSTMTANFGASSFVGSAPSGFSDANTANGSPVTWNPSDKNANITLSGGNLVASDTGSVGSTYACRATASFSSGKIYWEVTFGWLTSGASARTQSNTPDGNIGVANSTETLTNAIGATTNSIGWGASTGNLTRNNSTQATLHTYNPVTAGNERCFKNNGSTITSGATQPSWSLGSGATTSDNGGTWTEVTGTNANGWNACWARMNGFASNRGASGDTVMVGDNHAEFTGGITTVNLGSTLTNNFYSFVSVDHTVSSPTSANALAGAAFTFVSAIATLGGFFSLNGFTITHSGSSGTVQLGNASVQRYVNCTLSVTSTSGDFLLSGGGSSNVNALYFDGCTCSSSVSNGDIFRASGGKNVFRGGSWTTSGRAATQSTMPSLTSLASSFSTMLTSPASHRRHFSRGRPQRSSFV
jgi:hypothetical protein